MNSLAKYEPYNNLVDVDRLLKYDSGDDIFDITSISPKIRVHERENRLIVETELPGIDKKDVKIRVKDNILIISGETRREKTDEKKGKYYYNERYYGSFYKKVTLPVKVSDKNASSTYNEGIYKIEFPIVKEKRIKALKAKNN